jgi:dGTPase
MEGRYDGNILDLLDPTDLTFKMIYGAKALGRKSVYNDIKKIEMEIGCYAIFDVLLKEFCSAALNQAVVLSDRAKEATLSWKSGHVLQLLGDHGPATNNGPPDGWSPYQCLRRVIDFVMGMTDNYAVYISQQLQGVAFAGLQRP